MWSYREKTTWKLVLIAVGSLSSTLISYWLFRQEGERFYFWATLLWPLPFGYWFGRVWKGNHLLGYFLTSLGLALPELIGITAIWKQLQLVVLLPRGWTQLLWQAGFSEIFLFTAGGTFADFMEQGAEALRRDRLRDPSRGRLAILGPPLITAIGAIIAAIVGILSVTLTYPHTNEKDTTTPFSGTEQTTEQTTGQ